MGFGASLLGVDSGVPIVSFIPVMLFAILFGLSMDYNVFLLSRIHEAYNEGDGPRESVIHGMARIGKVVLFAGLIMAAVFLAFVAPAGRDREDDGPRARPGDPDRRPDRAPGHRARPWSRCSATTPGGCRAGWTRSSQRLARGPPRRGPGRAGAGAGAGLGQRAARREPDAVEREVGLLGDQVVVAVVVQDAEPVAVGDRGDEQVDGRQPVVADARELALRVERALLDVVVDREAGRAAARRAARRARARRAPSSRPRAGTAGRWRSGRPRARRRSRRRAPRAARRAVPRPSCPAAAWRSRPGPAGAADLVGGVAVDREVAAADPVGRARAAARRRPRARRAAARAFSLAPRITSSPSSTRAVAELVRAARRAPRATGGVSVIAWRGLLVGMP